MKRQQGVVLILVLVVIVLLMLVAGAMTTTRRTDAALTFNLVDQVKGQALVQAGVNYAALRLLGMRSDSDWRPERGQLHWQFDNADLTIQVQDVRGLINLNKTSNAVLSAFFENMGLAEEEVPILIDQIHDWRDKNQTHRLNGAEDEEYQDLGLPYGAKDANFDHIEELRLLPAINDIFFAKIKPYLTIRNSGTRVIPAFAPEAILRALPNVDEATVDNLLMNRQNATNSDSPITVNIGKYFVIRVDIKQADFIYSGQAEIQLQRTHFNILSWQYGLKPQQKKDNNETELENN